MVSFLSFSFIRSGAHRYLHSFPTRRSSDLAGTRDIRMHAVGGDERDLGGLENRRGGAAGRGVAARDRELDAVLADQLVGRDRKSTRLNSSHVAISYAVFCLKKKNISKKNCV